MKDILSYRLLLFTRVRIALNEFSNQGQRPLYVISHQPTTESTPTKHHHHHHARSKEESCPTAPF